MKFSLKAKKVMAIVATFVIIAALVPTWLFTKTVKAEVESKTVWDLKSMDANAVNINGTTGTVEATTGTGTLSVDATTGKLVTRGSDAQFNKGAKISIPVTGSGRVIVESYPGYHKYTVGGDEANADIFTKTYDGDGTIDIIATSTAYLYTITLEKDKEVKADAQAFKLVLQDYFTEAGSYAAFSKSYGDSTIQLNSKGTTAFSVQGTITVDGKEMNVYSAGARPSNSNGLTSIPAADAGTSAQFTAAANGMMTVAFKSAKTMNIYDFNGAELVKKIETSANQTEYSYAVEAGHTYYMVSNGTDKTWFGSFEYIPNKKVSVDVSLNNIDVTSSIDSLELSLVDAGLGGSPMAVIKKGTTSVQLYEGHTYKIQSNDGGVRAAVGDYESFKVDGSAKTIDLHSVPDVTLTGEITGTPVGTVSKLTFTNMANGSVFEATIDGANYTCSMKPGEYNSSVVTSNGGVTYDRVSVKSEGTNVNEVWVEFPDDTNQAVQFKSQISIPEDYPTLNKAVAAINAMTDRPAGEEGRVTITLNKDCVEQVVMNAPYVTLKSAEGQKYTVSWYYGSYTYYYSMDPTTFYYSERLARDKYSSVQDPGSTWGKVFVVEGGNFIAENVIFKNTYNYELTELEKTDIAGTGLAVSRLAEGANVANYAYKERANAFWIGADNIECYNCEILSSQDALGRNGGSVTGFHAYFKNCIIGGNVDYICGSFSAVFDECTLQWKTYADEKNNQIGYIAVPKTEPYVFRNCIITKDNADVEVKGALGRTWGAGSVAAFINTNTGNTLGVFQAGGKDVNGWGEMNTGDSNTAVFSEYGLTLDGTTPYASACTYPGFTTDLASVEKYIDSDTNSAVKTVLGGWTPVHYNNPTEPKTYDVVEGADGKVEKAEDKAVDPYTIKVDADFAKFTKVLVDGVEVDAKNYTAVAGSTVITFKADYIATLTEGEHKVEVIFTDGQATTTLTVAKAATQDPAQDPAQTPTQEPTSVPATQEPVKTGDTAPIALYLILMMSATGVALVSKKKSVVK